MTILDVEGLTVKYGQVSAVSDMCFHIAEGELVSLIGANGAGKTSLLKCVMGAVPSAKGDIRFSGASLGCTPVEDRVRRGMYLVPEKRSLFNSMSVRDNLQLGLYANRGRINFAEEVRRIYSLFPILEERQEQLAGTLSGGQQQMVAIGRALIARPQLLLLDEPSIGLAPLVVQQIMEIVVELQRKEGLTVILVEQNARLALSAANRAYLIELGRIIKSGTGEELAADPHLSEIYLGAKRVAA
ncbi:ABC transporter ATP-binding protein [Burkholderia anthina]|uniref:ABC transporter ATP-binding protein n=1 Tax=Burkholderia anthina TaxID=179879 RepID=UPI00158CCDB7|nr:ABC transporter ATP-binding protein [Burkholderia anthina]